jgi:hypothetical protein
VGLKVAIVGLAPTTRHLVPWSDSSWEKWGMAWDFEHYLEFHRAFEIHDMAEMQAAFPNVTEYLAKIGQCASLYMAEEYLPGARRFPDEAVAGCGDYLCSSIAFMLALAIHEGAEEIGLYCVDMRADEEYFYQRANCEYLIGLARGRGIAVHIPEQSPLCKFQNPPGSSFAGRYGRT